MRANTPKHPIIFILLCIALCAGLALALSGRALAAGSEAPGITVEIFPPTGSADQSVPVGFCITDRAGDGFQSAEVKLGDGQWQDVTNTLERWENRYIGRLTLTDNCAVTVRVTGQDGAVYEKTRYIDCFENGTQLYLSDLTVRQDGAQVQAADEAPGSAAVVHPVDVSASASEDPDTEPDTSPRPTTLTPDGQGTVLDDVSGEEGKEFFTIKTPNENIFYLVIDKQRDSENVYFLNAVTESDLAALAVKDSEPASTSGVPDPEPVCACTEKCAAGAVNTACPVCLLNLRDCKGMAPVNVEQPEPEKPTEGGNAGLIVIVLLVVLAVGAAGWYFKIYKPKRDLDDAEDLETLTAGPDEPTVNEDDQPEIRTPREPGDREPYPAYVYEPEPQEPDDPAYAQEPDYPACADEPEDDHDDPDHSLSYGGGNHV